METNLKILRGLAQQILSSPQAFSWSLQGLGMLRLYLGDNLRMHVWDRRFAYPNASPIHDHLQWGLHSTIIAGKLTNMRFDIVEGEPTHKYATLKAGYGCYFKHDPIAVRLSERSHEVYLPGDTYSQEPNEIHWSVPVNGTVTIMEKYPTIDGESARVFWDIDREWGSAEPKPATLAEVHAITSFALKEWF